MSPVRINYWAEGATDRAVARKLISHVGGEPGNDYSARRGASPGKDYLDRKIASFNAAAQFAPWLVLRDCDSECAAELAASLIVRPALNMRFRIVVHAVEAWLLADREAFAGKLAVAEGRLPRDPEAVNDVKGCVIELAQRSRSRHVREDLVPHAKSGRRVGPGYADFLIEFIDKTWHPQRASKNSHSLGRAITRLTTLVPSES